MNCETQLQLRAIQLEEDRLEFEKERHNDYMELEYAKLGLSRKKSEPSEATLEDLLGAILSGRNSF